MQNQSNHEPDEAAIDDLNKVIATGTPEERAAAETALALRNGTT